MSPTCHPLAFYMTACVMGVAWEGYQLRQHNSNSNKDMKLKWCGRLASVSGYIYFCHTICVMYLLKRRNHNTEHSLVASSCTSRALELMSSAFLNDIRIPVMSIYISVYIISFSRCIWSPYFHIYIYTPARAGVIRIVFLISWTALICWHRKFAEPPL